MLGQSQFYTAVWEAQNVQNCSDVIFMDGPLGARIWNGGGKCSLAAYEGVDVFKWIASVTLQPLVPDQAFMPHIKAMNVPFHLLYGSLICSKILKSDRQKC